MPKRRLRKLNGTIEEIVEDNFDRMMVECMRDKKTGDETIEQRLVFEKLIADAVSFVNTIRNQNE